MTHEEINITIAQACGWRIDKLTEGWKSRMGYRPIPGTTSESWENIPNYAGSLDAMAEARKALTTTQREDYLERLKHMTSDPSNMWSGWRLLDATAAQHAEAFLKCLGLWSDQPIPMPE